jgi:hypothetical protein
MSGEGGDEEECGKKSTTEAQSTQRNAEKARMRKRGEGKIYQRGAPTPAGG